MDEIKDQVASDEPSISEELSRFTAHIDSLAETIDLMMFTIDRITKKTGKDLIEFEKKYGEVEEIERGRRVRFQSDKQFKNYVKLVIKNNKYALADKLIPRSILISLISQYDILVGGIIRVLSKRQPKSLNLADKTLTFSQLQNFRSIEEAREHLIEKEIDSVLRLSHSEQVDWLEGKYNLPLRKGLKIDAIPNLV